MPCSTLHVLCALSHLRFNCSSRGERGDFRQWLSCQVMASINILDELAHAAVSATRGAGAGDWLRHSPVAELTRAAFVAPPLLALRLLALLGPPLSYP